MSKSHRGQSRRCAVGCTCGKHSRGATRRMAAAQANNWKNKPQEPRVSRAVLKAAYARFGTLDKTGEHFGVHSGTILYWMKRYNLPRNSRNIQRVIDVGPSGLELIVRRTLTQLGIRWRGGVIVRGFFPDLYLPEFNTLVEINGCYWHACQRCFPKSRRKAQRVRDRQKLAVYYELGYNVLVLWEHDIVYDPTLAVLEKMS